MRRFNEPNNRFTFLPKKNYILNANSEFTFLTKKIHLIFNKSDNIEIKQQKRSLHSSFSDWNSILVLPAFRTIADSMSPWTRSPTNRTDIIVKDRACDTTSIILQPVTQELRVIFAIVKAKLAKPISQVIEHFHACVLTLKLSWNSQENESFSRRDFGKIKSLRVFLRGSGSTFWLESLESEIFIEENSKLSWSWRWRFILSFEEWIQLMQLATCNS